MIDLSDKYCYIARKVCGCVIGVCTDQRNKDTARSVAEFISGGLTVDRVVWARYREIAKEPTFFACPHKPCEHCGGNGCMFCAEVTHASQIETAVHS